MDKEFHFKVRIYYEDTDHSGIVYHANYLKYFERAREHAIGDELFELIEKGLSFTVYRVDIKFSAGFKFGDELDIISRVKKDGDYKMVWTHEIWNEEKPNFPAVKAEVQLAFINEKRGVEKIPELKCLKF